MLSPTSVETIPANEPELNQWQFAELGIRWSRHGVLLTALSAILLLINYLIMRTATTPSNTYPTSGAVAQQSILSLVLTYGSLISGMLSLFAFLIGLSLCSFAPRPSIARFFSIGSLLLLVMSHISATRLTMLLLNFLKPEDGDRVRFDSGWLTIELTTISITSIAEYAVSLILGCCFLLAIAGEFQNRALIRGVQNYLKLLFGIPIVILVLGLFFTLLLKANNPSHSWVMPTATVVLTLIYLWMCYSLIMLLQSAHQTITSNLFPKSQRPAAQFAPKPTIDPLAD